MGNVTLLTSLADLSALPNIRNSNERANINWIHREYVTVFPWYENYVTMERWSAGRVVYRIISIAEWHNFHVKETQLNILFITYLFNYH